MRTRRIAAAFVLFTTTLLLVLVAPKPATATTLVGTAQVAAGDGFSCVLTTAGAAYCWGQNDYGQLGNGSNTNSLVPVAVSGSHVFTKIAAGASYACALDTSGDAWCWGHDSWGALGTGTGDTNVPAAVTGGHTFTSIAIGASIGCALDTSGDAWCWGGGWYGGLGTGSTSNQAAPAAVVGSHTFTSISILMDHVCAIDTGNDAWCWGLNDHGQLGDGSTTNRSSPAAVTGSHKFSAVTAGFRHSCGITSSGVAWCWGSGGQGQIGDGNWSADNTSPILVSGGLSFSSIDGGYTETCAITTAGAAYCWGGDSYGELGAGSPGGQLSPYPVSNGYHWQALSVSIGQAVCGVTTGGGVYCWGQNDVGRIGDNTTTDRNVPTATYLAVEVNNTTISAVIDPSFTFTVGGSATVCNGQSGTNFQTSATGTEVSLGHIGPATVGGGAQDLSVATNAGSGFTAYIRTSSTTPNALRSGGNSITDVSGTRASPGAAPVAGTAGFGYTSSDVFASNTFAKLTNSDDSVLVGSAGTATKSTCVGYEVAASPSTPAAAYAITTIYTAVPTF